jgi:DNA-binding CsgD family transcriptional regulator
MSYWNQILSEVLNRHDPRHATKFTNVREYVQQQITPVKKALSTPTPKKRRPRGIVQKKTQICGEAKKYILGQKFQGIYFTRREAQVALCCLRGKSTVQIAALLKLSRRTVEFYINNMKVKLNCRFKSELIAAILQSDFLALLDVPMKIFSNA